jgi:hypothetical protein
MLRRHSFLREGIITGFFGATVVAVWFLIVDGFAGRPLYTPDVLGSGLLRVFGPPGDEGMFAHVVAYTIFHYAAFFVVGIVAVVIVHEAEHEAAVLAGALILFVAFEVGSYGLIALLAQSRALGQAAWLQVGIANLLAAATMGTYLWRTHPGLKEEFVHALSGEE